VGSPSVGGQSEGTSHSLRKLQEKDTEFPMYDGNPDNFLAWLVAVEELKDFGKVLSGGNCLCHRGVGTARQRRDCTRQNV